MTSMDIDIQRDLDAAFKLLYGEEQDDGDDWDDDSDSEHVEPIPGQEPIEPTKPVRVHRLTRKRLQAALDALFTTDATAPPPPKRPRMAAHSTRIAAVPPPTKTFAPTSLTLYRSRLLTFTLTNYSPKPRALGPANVARYGWKSSDHRRDRIECVNCGAAWVVQGLTDPRVQRNPGMKKRLVGLLEEQLTCAHQRNCPWRVQPCPTSIHYRLLTLHPLLSSRLAEIAVQLVSYTLNLEHPLDIKGDLSDVQIKTLVQTLQANLAASQWDSKEGDAADNITHNRLEDSVVTRQAANLAFFGWKPLVRPGRESEPVSGSSSLTSSSKPIQAIVTCTICQRTLNLAGSATKRAPILTPVPNESATTIDTTANTSRMINVVQEHREFCPIRVYAHATSNPSTSTSPADDQTLQDPSMPVPWWKGAVLLDPTRLVAFEQCSETNLANMAAPTTHPPHTRREVMDKLHDILGKNQVNRVWQSSCIKTPTV